MTPSPLQAQFDKIKAEHAGNRETKLLGRALGAVQAAVKQFQEEGIGAGLVVRPSSIGLEHQRALPVLANGTITLEGLDIPFAVEKPERGAVDSLHLHLFLGNMPRTIWISDRNDAVAENVVASLLRIRAEREFAESFSLTTTGISKMTLEKFPAPKLGVRNP